MDKLLAVDSACDDEWNAQPGWLAGGQSVLGTTVHTVSSAYLGRERVRGLQAMPLHGWFKKGWGQLVPIGYQNRLLPSGDGPRPCSRAMNLPFMPPWFRVTRWN